MNDPDPPTVGMPFSEWISPTVEPEPEQPQALRVLHWLDTRIPSRRLLDSRDDLVASVYLKCIERFTHNTTGWQGPLAKFARLQAMTFFREQSREARNKQFVEGEDGACAAANFVDQRSNSNVAGRDGVESPHTLQTVQQLLDDFDAKWLQQEVAVLRQMPAGTRTHMGLLLHEWTWREIAAHFGEDNFRIVDTNWRNRGEASFRDTWKSLYGADNYDLYHAERETKRLAVRKLKDFGREEGLSQ